MLPLSGDAEDQPTPPDGTTGTTVSFLPCEAVRRIADIDLVRLRQELFGVPEPPAVRVSDAHER
ncbi:hypothetical protein [Pseudonocardia phyllosphaerae]|uniref:hypothetical protein n=1 Tax=Pseudonocardia phyllosphaerae TaxID=3390502 RepID=UPI00397E105F